MNCRMKTILGYEIKKIIMKKSTIIAFLLLFCIQLIISISGSFGNSYVNDVFLETHVDRNRIDRENGLSLSGRVIDDRLITEVREAYSSIDEDNCEYLTSDAYQHKIRKYSDLRQRLRLWGVDLSKSYDKENILYELRQKEIDAMWDEYKLSDKEKEYWIEKEQELEKPFTYQYATAYEYLVDMSGMYMISMLMTFFIAITMVNVFAEEHNRKTDQLVLCSRYGRGKLYIAKLLAGSIIAFLANLIFLVMDLVGNFISYGSEGFKAMLQVTNVIWYSYQLSVGEALIIMIGLMLVSSIMIALVVMLLAEILRNNIGAMAIIIGGLFAARLLMIPPKYGTLSKLWNYIPINILKVDQGFTDPRLVSFFGIQLTTWKFAPILYTFIIVGICLIGSKLYKNYQISGR